MAKKKKPAIRFKGFIEEWEQCKIGDYYYFKNGLNKGKEFFGDGVPIVNFIDVFHNRGINASSLKGKVNLQASEIANYNVQKGDIFFTRTSETIDEIGYSSVMLDEPKDTVFSGFVLRGRAIEKDPLTINFKQYIFYTNEFRREMIKKSSMTTRALTSGTAIKQMDFYFSKDKGEQDKIGLYFRELDHLITLHQRKYEKLQNVKKSMLEKMFPQNGKNVPEIRFKGFKEDWEQCKLNELVDRVVRKNINNESTLPLTISAQYGLVDQIIYFNNRVASRDVSNYYLVLKGEFAYNKSTSDGYPFGAVKRLDMYQKGVLSTLYIVFSVKNLEKTNSDFMTIFFDTDRWHKGVSERAAEGARNHGLLNISVEDFFDIDLFIPQSEKEQAQIGAYFKELDHLISLHQRKLEKLQNIKKSCLEKMFV